MFNLEKSIADWRKQMLAAGIKSPVPLEELEIHLREEIGRLVQSGLDEQNAFAAAVQKMGPVHAIRNEFEKAGGAPRARIWMFYEIFMLAFALLNPIVVGAQAFYLKDGRFSDMTSSQQISSVAAAATLSCFALGMRWIYGKFPVVHTIRMSEAILVLVVIWLLAQVALDARGIMPRYDFSEGQKGVVSLWGFAPFGIMVGWACGYANVARKKVTTIVS
jgi:hypothetical protein